MQGAWGPSQFCCLMQPCAWPCLNRQLAPVLRNVQQRVLLLTGEGDLLIPSREEGPRLQKLLPRCQLKARLISLVLEHSPDSNSGSVILT